MSKERKQLEPNEQKLLEFSAGDLIPMLEKNKELQHVRQQAFQYYSTNNKEIFEVHVTVTRHAPDFLEPFTTEEMRSY